MTWNFVLRNRLVGCRSIGKEGKKLTLQPHPLRRFDTPLESRSSCPAGSSSQVRIQKAALPSPSLFDAPGVFNTVHETQLNGGPTVFLVVGQLVCDFAGQLAAARHVVRGGDFVGL